MGFTAAVLTYIWVLRGRWPWTVWIVAALASALAMGARGQTAGLSRAAGWGLAAGAVAAAAAGRQAFVYWAWCTAQQAVLQLVVYRRLRSAWCCGLIFSAVHLPNPVLAPATLLWGALACRLFERYRNFPVLGIVQTLLSWGLLAVTPRNWHRNFRVGPGYFDWTSSSHTAASFLASLSHP